MAKAPSDQAVLTALDEGLPRTLLVLERRLNDALIDSLPKRMLDWIVREIVALFHDGTTPYAIRPS